MQREAQMPVVARPSWRQEQRHMRSIVGKTARTDTDGDSESYVNDRAMSVAPVRAVRGTGICGYPPPPSCRAGPTDTFSGGISMLARINSGNQCLSFIMYAATHVYDLTFF